MVDFFISYNRNDEAWAIWVAKELDKNNYKTRSQVLDFVAGDNFIIQMHKAITESERTIVILSNQFLKSSFTTPEWASAIASDPMSLKQSLVPIRVKDCRPDGLLKGIVYIDLLGLSEQKAKVKLLREIGKLYMSESDRRNSIFKSSSVFPGKQGEELFPGTSQNTKIVNIHHFISSRNFVGRKTEINTLHDSITNSNKKIISIVGIGGIGKTELTKHIVNRISKGIQVFEIIVWYSLSNSSSIGDRQFFIDLLKHLDYEQYEIGQNSNKDKHYYINAVEKIFDKKKILLLELISKLKNELKELKNSELEVQKDEPYRSAMGTLSSRI